MPETGSQPDRMERWSREAGVARLIESSGLGSFITRRIFLRPDGTRFTWLSRQHRKSLRPLLESRVLSAGALLLRCLWMPSELNWWIGTVFAIGSFLFGLGGVLCLLPAWASALHTDITAINVIFFAGSIPFTTAAYLQLFQAANVGKVSPEDGTLHRPSRPFLFGWMPRDIGWLSCALQFVGTIFFNFNTLDSLIPDLGWIGQDIVVWIPDFLGSALFLVSGYLAFVETCHARWRWEPGSISWWVTFTNLVGCVAFMLSAFFAFIPPQGLGATALAFASAFTLIGALGFLVGSLLMLPETAR